MDQSAGDESFPARIAVASEYLNNRNASYDGPSEFRGFAEFLAPIGEVVLAFSRLERRLTWAIESALGIGIDDANAIEASIMSVPHRIGLFSTVARSRAADNNSLLQSLDSISNALLAANDYRNSILHNPWIGTQGSFHEDGSIETMAATKVKFAPMRAKKSVPANFAVSAEEMREKVVGMLALSNKIQAWVLEVFPDAQNRVP